MYNSDGYVKDKTGQSLLTEMHTERTVSKHLCNHTFLVTLGGG